MEKYENPKSGITLIRLFSSQIQEIKENYQNSSQKSMEPIFMK